MAELSNNRNTVAKDESGCEWKLTHKIGEGGQGEVFGTDISGYLAKLVNFEDDKKLKNWSKRIRWAMRQDLGDLNLARPIAMLTEPKPGYIMEMMDELVPLRQILDASYEALLESQDFSVFRSTGGLQRRYQLLGKLARELAELHGRGIVYGDLSPDNVFVSSDPNFSELWLIDCDNLATNGVIDNQAVFTSDYGAPELVRCESGINSLTDSWGFAVIAFQLLTFMHPLKGEMVIEGDEVIEERALRGELPWIENPIDNSNAAASGKRGLFNVAMTKKLTSLFQQCFTEGLHEPAERPSMMEWAEAFEQASMATLNCKNEGCGQSFIYNRAHQCPFCDGVINPSAFLLLKHYYYTPEFEADDNEQQGNGWINSHSGIVITVDKPVSLKKLDPASALYHNSAPLCQLELTSNGLYIIPVEGQVVHLQRTSDSKTSSIQKRQLLKAESRSNARFALHLEDMSATHPVWIFNW
ncbi:protein kinase domain-containing protein [Shewanella xiamenensis]|uniref:protein kinase domain-containing protein n=1 Tax=Shewanella xiamenensis TaxID=332186 RepID=UPI0015598B9A|nr:protein kinase [Shewanella xiamenensis]